ncbi:hypothetical protein LDENG_00199200, partial [Lucifuga dentata]
MDYFHLTHNSDADFLSTGAQQNSLSIRWFMVTDRTSLLAELSDGVGGMLVVQVGSDTKRPGLPVVETSRRNSEPLTLQ